MAEADWREVFLRMCGLARLDYSDEAHDSWGSWVKNLAASLELSGYSRGLRRR